MNAAASPVPRTPWGLWRSPYLWLATIHLLGDSVVVLTSGLLVLCATIVVLLGLPFALIGIPLSMWANRLVYVIAGWERARARITRGQQVQALVPRQRTASRTDDALLALGDPGLWRQFGYYVALLLLATVWIFAVVVAWSIPPVLIALPAYYTRFAASQAQLGPFVVDNMTSATIVAVLAGVFLIFVSPLIMRAASAFDGRLVKELLGPSESGALAERVHQLVQSRQQVVDSVESERRRMERDLHDGAQQRLVALAVDLGRARAKLDADPSAPPETRQMIAEAHEEAKQTLAELRDLVRGIHPAVLSDRGLDAALSALAARCPVPVTVQSNLADTPRCSPSVEAVAYFVVAEALTNLAKHAKANRAGIRATRDPDAGTLTVDITDDGIGGADPDGVGLHGLADRAHAVDGDLTVTSPTGGPTTVTVRLPCA